MKTTLAVSFAVLVAGIRGYAWNSFGHMTVACVAYQKLTPQSKQRASTLLKFNPQYQTWLSWVPTGTSAADRDMMIFMMAATWPDEIKGLPHHLPPFNPVTGNRYVADGSERGNRPEGSPNAFANEGYSDDSMHKYWHFVDKPFSRDNTPLPSIPVPNAGDRIALFRSVLAGNAGDGLKSYDLAWLLHLVGDVHQPLHCATRVSATETNGDNGGNFVLLASGELHGAWDAALGSGTDKAIVVKVIKVATNLPDADQTLAADADENHWIDESFHAAQTDAYVTPIGSDDGPFTLTAAYKSNMKTVAQQRVALAGARLANLINANLK